MMTVSRYISFLLLIIGTSLFIYISIQTHGLYTTGAGVMTIVGTLLSFIFFIILTKDYIVSIWIIIVIVLGLSFLPSDLKAPISFGLLIIFLLSIIYSSYKHNSFNYLNKFTPKYSMLDLYTLVIVLLILPFIGYYYEYGFVARDQLHPLYELSISHTYNISLFNPPDLSYYGKELRYHFLTSQLYSYFANIFKISILESVYYIVPLFCFTVIILLFYSFFQTYPQLWTPLPFLLFLPFGWEGHFIFSVFSTVVLATPSYALAFPLMGTAIYFMHKDKYILFIICASMLTLTKASFFLVLFGGLALHSLRQREIKNIILLVVIAGVFTILYKLFLSGAHEQNFWMIFPGILFNFIFCGKLSTAYCLIFYAIVIYIFITYKINDFLRIITTISMAGIIGTILITEATESNSTQFWIATYPFTAIVVWYWYSNIKNKYGYFIKNTLKILILLLISISILYYTTTMTINYLRFYQPELYKELWVGNNLIKSKIGIKHKTEIVTCDDWPCLSNDFIAAYTWLGDNCSKDKVIVFGKHYEKAVNPFSPFARSALSGCQMYIENTRYKGVGMQKDFPQRSANTLYFYLNFVQCSPDSRDQLDKFFMDSFGASPGVPLSQKHTTKGNIAYFLGFMKEWSGLNREPQIDWEIRNHLSNMAKYKEKDEWLSNFLTTAKIGYIVLELGDHASSYLQKYVSIAYKNSSVTILKVIVHPDES